MQTVAIAFAVLIAVSAAMPTDLFEMFERKYNKKYATEEERSNRLHIFTETLKRIEQLNKDEPMRPHGINEFADLTQDEFRARFLMNAEQFASTRVSLADAPMVDLSALSFDLPSEFDWRNNGSVITPVKNQEQCGSCWAFSTTENIESVWAIAGNGLLQLAPQQIVDCDTTDDGCNGGNPPTAYEYVIKAGGLELESSYPYTAKNGKCTAQASLEVAKIKGYNWATKTKNESEIQVALYNVAPLSICVDAITWQTYTSGIITKNCGTSLDHCVQLTGWGTQGGINYWSVRNSWGASWGEDGYIRVEMGKDLCGIA
jgi:C1A family cysteine protease